jgi:hypothetical protein
MNGIRPLYFLGSLLLLALLRFDASADTERVSVANDGTEGNDSSTHPQLSSDGRFVVFISEANNLVPRGRWVWGARASPRAISGVPPENFVRRDAEHQCGDAYAPRRFRGANISENSYENRSRYCPLLCWRVLPNHTKRAAGQESRSFLP